MSNAFSSLVTVLRSSTILNDEKHIKLLNKLNIFKDKLDKPFSKQEISRDGLGKRSKNGQTTVRNNLEFQFEKKFPI